MRETDSPPRALARLPTNLVSRSQVLLGVGLAAWSAAVVSYARAGARDEVTLLFAAGLVAIAFALPGSRERLAIHARDLVVCGLIVAALAPFYLIDLHDTPWQINSDEVTIMRAAQRVAAEARPDAFGLSDYFGFPALPFLAFARLTDLLGGMSLAHMRLVHATTGLLTIAAAYCLFRLLLPRPTAIVATVLLGANHALLAISRMAMREDTGILCEAVSLSLLFYGLTRGSARAAFLGGAIAGLGWYVYFPGRAAIAIWFLFLLGAALLMRDQVPWRLLLRQGGLTLLGFLLFVTPLAIATVQAENNGSEFAKQRILIFPEGRQLQVEWSGGLSEAAALRQNVWRGLTTFNLPHRDQGNIYTNRGHGFLDPLTGVLLWLGVAITGYRLLRVRPHRPGVLLALAGFGVLYLSSAFILTQAPNFTRLLIILPFVAYLSAVAVEAVAAFLTTRFRFRFLQPAWIVGGLTALVLVWNLAIFADFARTGHGEGDPIGSSGRYAEARAGIGDYTYYIVADADHPFYDWGDAGTWRNWLGFFAGDQQDIQVVAPASLAPERLQAPFTVFTSVWAWDDIGVPFMAAYPDAVLVPMMADGQIFAIEVP